MESRWCRLTLEAFKRGILDYSERRDWRWKLKERLVLDSIETELAADINQLAHHWHCAAAQITGWDETESVFEYHQKQARRAYNVIGKSKLPWYKWEHVEDKPLAQLWKEFKQREKDPKYAAYLKKLRDDLRESAGEGARTIQANKEMLKRYHEAQKKLETKKLEQRRRR